MFQYSIKDFGDFMKDKTKIVELNLYLTQILKKK
jgi:hypothetical protein